jgi:hypothetical protein
MYLNLNKAKKNRKKPVETKEMGLTKRSERLKVNCGTVLRTRMNIDDFALKKRCGLRKLYAGRASGPKTISNVRRSNTKWQRE